MNSIPAYIIKSLKHAYERTAVLDIPDLTIESGRVYCIAGPNGSGKTTLLSILALLFPPTAGSVLLFGADCARPDVQLRRKVTFVHQKPILFSTSVKNNISYGLRAHGFPSEEVKRRTSAMLEAANLLHVAESKADKLSGGEAQRTVLARALALETPILLLDEPTNSLDDVSKPIIIKLLEGAQNRGATIVIATHDMSLADSLPAEILRLEKGRLAIL
jgi:tungstate transport system ATP-binding protein